MALTISSDKSLLGVVSSEVLDDQGHGASSHTKEGEDPGKSSCPLTLFSLPNNHLVSPEESGIYQQEEASEWTTPEVVSEPGMGEWHLKHGTSCAFEVSCLEVSEEYSESIGDALSSSPRPSEEAFLNIKSIALTEDSVAELAETAAFWSLFF